MLGARAGAPGRRQWRHHTDFAAQNWSSFLISEDRVPSLYISSRVQLQSWKCLQFISFETSGYWSLVSLKDGRVIPLLIGSFQDMTKASINQVEDSMTTLAPWKYESFAYPSLRTIETLLLGKMNETELWLSPARQLCPPMQRCLVVNVDHYKTPYHFQQPNEETLSCASKLHESRGGCMLEV